MLSFFDFLMRKDAVAADVHATTALGDAERKRKPRKISPTTKLPVTDMTAAAMAEAARQSVDEVERNADWSMPLTIAKADPDKRLIFGWASVVEKAGLPVIDKQGDIIPVEELEKAAYDFVLHSRQNDDRHAGGPTGRCIESIVFTKDKQQALGIDLGKVGWWVGFKVDDDALWAAHKRGERPEFSIGGGAVREVV
jgi:hypothetical protein